MITPRAKRRLEALPAGFLLFAGLVSAGCNPPLDPSKYGEVLTKMPQVQGADQPYQLPLLQDPADQGEDKGENDIEK